MGETEILEALRAGLAEADGPQPLGGPRPKPIRLGDLPEPSIEDQIYNQLAMGVDRLDNPETGRVPGARQGALTRAGATGLENLSGLPGRALEGVGTFLGSDALEGAGRAIQPDLVTDEEAASTPGQIGGAIGSGAGYLAAGGLGSAAGLGLRGAGALTATTAGLETMPDAYYGALANGASPEKAWFAAVTESAAVGWLERFGVQRRVLAKVFGEVDQATGGGLRGLLVETGKNAIEEGAEEGIQSIVGDMIAQKLYDVAPDEDWPTILGQAVDAAKMGAIGGGVLGAAFTGVQRYKAEQEPEPAPVEERSAPVYDPVERDLTPEETSALDQWKEARGATRADVVERPEAEEAVEFARKAGATVLFVDDDGKGAKDAATYEGNTIILPANADPSSAMLAVATHEAVHALPLSVRDALIADLGKETKIKGPSGKTKTLPALSEKHRAAYADKADREGLRVTKRDLDEEGVADLAASLAPVMRRLVTRQSSAVGLMHEKPGVAVRLLRAVQSVFGKSAHAEAMSKDLEALAEVSDSLARGLTGRQRVQAAQRIVKAFEGIKGEMSRPVRVKKPAKAETGMVPVGEVRDNNANAVQAKGERSRAMLGEVAAENETYRPTPITLGESQRFEGVSDEDLRARRDKAAESQAYESDLALREAGFSDFDRAKYRKARNRAVVAQRALDMARNDAQASEARQEVQDAARRLKRYESRMSEPQRARLRSGEDPEVYDRVIAAREAKAKGRFGSERALDRAVPSVRYSLSKQDQSEWNYQRREFADAIQAKDRDRALAANARLQEIASRGKVEPDEESARLMRETAEDVMRSGRRAVGADRPYTDAESAWAEDQIEMGHTPEEVRNAVESARAYGVDVTKSDNLYSLEAYMDGLDADGPRYSLRSSQTDTPEFRAWFGDSKVVDGDGKPLVVYHGTAGPEFNTFRTPDGVYPSASIGDSEVGMVPGGIYFATDPKHASSYALNGGATLEASGRAGGARVMPVYIRAENPLIADSEDSITPYDLTPDKVREIRAQGYDAVFFAVEPIKSAADADEIVVFSKFQAKSATGNNGDFGKAKGDIRYSLRSDIEAAAQDLAATEPEGYQVAGGATMPERMVRAVVRAANPVQVKHAEEMDAESSAILADRSAREKLAGKAMRGEALNEGELGALSRMASLKAINSWRNGTSMESAQEAELAVQRAKTTAARTLGNPNLRDSLQTPAERAMKLLLTPSRKIQRKFEKARTWQQRRAIAEAEARKVERVRYALSENGFDPRLIDDDYFKDPKFSSMWARLVGKHKQDASDWYIGWRRAAMLSGPLTTIRNLAGNTAHAGYDRVLRLAADALVPTSDTKASDVKEYVSMLLSSAPHAMQSARHYWETFYEQNGEGTSVDDQRNLRGGPIRTVVESVGIRTQAASDVFYREMLMAAETRLRSRQAARMHGGTWQDYESDPDVLDAARVDMERALFLDRDEITAAINAARAKLDAVVPIGSTILPFTSTPTQIVRRSGEVAAGPLAGLWREDEKGGSAILGLATWGAMLWLVSRFNDDDGLPLITGTRDERGKGAFQERTAPAYSIRIGDEYRSYQTMEPFAGVLASVADSVQSGNVLEGVGSFALGLKDKSFFRSLGTVWDAIVASGSGERGKDRAVRMARDLLWTPMIPNVLRAPVRASDPEKRKEIGDPLEGGDFIYPITGAYAPPLRYDLWGRPVEKPGSSVVARLLSPFPETGDVGDIERIDLLLGAHYRDKPDARYFDAPAVYQGEKENRRDWTEDEYSELTRDSGRAALDRLRPWAANKTELTERDLDHIGKVLARERKRKARELSER